MISKTKKENKIMDFLQFKKAVAKQFKKMSEGSKLFRVQIDKDLLWNTYLNSFPPGTNPIFRERTENDCSCCRHFIRNVGDVVSINKENKLISIWDIDTYEDSNISSFSKDGLSKHNVPIISNDDYSKYSIVAKALSKFVKSSMIENVFLHSEKTAGVDKTFEELVGDESKVKTWNHLFVNIPNEYVVKGVDIGSKLSETHALHDVLLRSLKEIDKDSIETVIELINQNSLYRGQENLFAVQSFLELKTKFSKITDEKSQDNFVWDKISIVPASVSKIRNTSIGTLLVNLSEGKDLEDAVKAFEAMVTPANYKRPTALVTKAMIASAKEKIVELGLTSALERRYATLSDITINDIIFANRKVRKSLKSDIFDEIASEVTDKPKKLEKVEEVSIEKFLSDIIPNAESIEVFLENTHNNNLVSLIAPTDPTSEMLFKWGNRFSWSYNGDMADSIKERVKQAGGSIVGDLLCRLAWDYADDLDFHMYEPWNYHIYYGNKRTKSPNGGMLDVDANGGDGIRENPVENIYYSKHQTMKNGVYRLEVNNYNRRSNGQGFIVEIEFNGQIRTYTCDKSLRTNESIAIAEITHKDGVFTIKDLIDSKETSKNLWNIQTQKFHQVSAIMNSPNYWEGNNVGNKHYFFMLENCKNDGTARGFFNEFLKEELNTHRKVMEMVGNKLKTENSDNQLSGLGFSVTQRNDLLCRVKGSFSRILKVKF